MGTLTKGQAKRKLASLDKKISKIIDALIAAGHGNLRPSEMRATVAGPELKERLNALSAELGPYPHAGLNLGAGRKKQGTRMLKCVCGSCGYTARTTGKWIETLGAPLCPCNSLPMNFDQAEGGDDA